MTVLLFPGQGAQYPGMGRDFYDAFETARETFQEANDLLSFHLSDVIFQGPESVLTQTKHSQLAIFVNSIALLRTIQKQFPTLKPAVCSGLSLGEYSALTASGRLGFEETLQLVRIRAEEMNKACETTLGTMAAVLGLDAEGVDLAIRGIDGVWVANYNSPGQIVISGTKEGIEAAAAPLKEQGAKRVLPLTVHGAFHSGLMKLAQEGLAPFIGAAHLTESDVRFVMNVPGDFVESLDTVKSNLTAQVTQSVRWDQGILAIEKTEPSLYLEIGCGKTLTGLNKKIGVKAPTLSIDKVADLETLSRHLEGVSCTC